MLKQRVYLHLENVAQLNDLNLDLLNLDLFKCAYNSGFARYLFQLFVLLEPDFNCGNDFRNRRICLLL